MCVYLQSNRFSFLSMQLLPEGKRYHHMQKLIIINYYQLINNVQFDLKSYEYDYRPNWTTRSPVTN